MCVSVYFYRTLLIPYYSTQQYRFCSGFVEAAFAGIPEAVFFLPQYSAGSMLAIVSARVYFAICQFRETIVVRGVLFLLQ